MGIEFGMSTASEALEKIKSALENSDIIKTNNKRYWEFWKLVEETEKDIASGLSKEQILYTIVADYGKPYDIKVGSEEQLKKELEHLKEIYERGGHPHFDVWVYDENRKDVTSEVFKRCLGI